MPIYAYRCSSCGHAKDVLQKMSDAPLSECPACGSATFFKQVTAAGFQLKGSGWYVTDFRGSSSGAAPASAEEKSTPVSASVASTTPASGVVNAASAAAATSTATAPASTTATPSAAQSSK